MGKRNLFVLLLMQCLLLPVASCRGQSMASGEGSTLSFRQTTWDFGEIEEVKGTVSHIFTFTNTGKEAIVIENVSVSCGCTVPEYPKKPVRPGDDAEIKVTYDPAMRSGFFSNDVHVVSGGGRNRDILTVKGEVIPRPRSVEEDYPFIMKDGLRLAGMSANLRNVAQGEAKSTKIKYVNSSEKDIALRFEIPANDGSVSIESPATICAGCKGEITFNCLVPAGGKYGNFTFKAVPYINGTKEALGITVTGTVTDNFTDTDETKAPKARLSSNFRNFGDVKKGEKPSREFTLFNEGASPLVVRAVETTSLFQTDLKQGTVVQPDQSIVIKCTLDTSGASTDGVTIQTLTIISNDPVRPSREIRLAATVKE